MPPVAGGPLGASSGSLGPGPRGLLGGAVAPTTPERQVRHMGQTGSSVPVDEHGGAGPGRRVTTGFDEEEGSLLSEGSYQELLA